MGWFDDARCPPSQASGVSRAHRPSVPRCLHSVPLTTLNGTPVGSSELVSWCAGAPICLTCRASRLAPPRSSGDVAAADFEIPVQRCVAAGAGPGPPATAGCHVHAPSEDGRTAPTSRAAGMFAARPPMPRSRHASPTVRDPPVPARGYRRVRRISVRPASRPRPVGPAVDIHPDFTGAAPRCALLPPTLTS